MAKRRFRTAEPDFVPAAAPPPVRFSYLITGVLFTEEINYFRETRATMSAC